VLVGPNRALPPPYAGAMVVATERRARAGGRLNASVSRAYAVALVSYVPRGRMSLVAARRPNQSARRQRQRASNAAFQASLRDLEGRKVSLNPGVADHLRQMLGQIGGRAPEIDRLLTEVEAILGRHEYLSLHFAGWARPSTVCEDARRLGRATRALQRVLEELDPYTAKQVTVVTDVRCLGRPRTPWPDPNSPNGRWREELSSQLSRIGDSATELASEYAEREARGRPINRALRMTVGGLCALFDEFHLKCKGEQPRRVEPSRCDFVIVALDAAGIEHPDDERFLRDYLPSPGSLLATNNPIRWR
jgi:hypothetical protein